jgi:hypothetical protein
MSFFALWSHIRKMENSGYDTTRLSVPLYESFALPAAPLVMVLIGSLRLSRAAEARSTGSESPWARDRVLVAFAVSSARRAVLLPPFRA